MFTGKLSTYFIYVDNLIIYSLVGKQYKFNYLKSKYKLLTYFFSESSYIYKYAKKILEKRIRYGKAEYFIKWRDYSDSENSWEPIENLDCEDLVEKYEEEIKRKSKPSNSIDFESSDNNS